MLVRLHSNDVVQLTWSVMVYNVHHTIDKVSPRILDESVRIPHSRDSDLASAEVLLARPNFQCSIPTDAVLTIFYQVAFQ